MGTSDQSTASCSGEAIGKRPEENRVEDAEDRGVCPKSQCEGQDSDAGKRRVPSQPAKGVPDIVSNTAHAATVSTRVPLHRGLNA